MTSSFRPLVMKAIDQLDRFKAGWQCLDDFILDAGKELQTSSPEQKQFVLDIVSGCVEHKKLLDAAINAFYEQNGKYLCKSEHSQFAIVCYLATFALDELGIQCFSSIVKSLDLMKMLKFLSFFFSNLTSRIQDEWSKIYDAAFVVEQWIDPLLKWRSKINILLVQMAEKLSQENQYKTKAIPPTVPQEFTFTEPKPRWPPSSEEIPEQIKTKPVPKSTYIPPKETQKINELKERNRQQAEELLFDANVQQFRCANPDKSEHTKREMAQIEKDYNSKLKFDCFQSSACPSTTKAESCHIKLNNAAIRRMEAHFEHQLEEELHKIEQLAQGGHEPSAFLQWQKDMQEKDLLDKICQDERRRLEAQISDKNAGLSRQQITEQNQKTAQQKKEETAQLMKEYAERRLQEEKTLKELVQQIAEGHQKSNVAKEELKKWNQSIVREVAKQNQELLRRALEEAQAELRRKCEIIHEIHSIESVPHVRFNYFDDTETAGHWLLDEMSLMELKERLAILQKAQQTQQEEKRKHIQEEKKKQKQLQLEMLDNIAFHKNVLAQAAAVRGATRKERKVQEDFCKQLLDQDETIMALRKTLQETKKEQQRLKQNKSKKVSTFKATSVPPGGSNHERNVQ